MVMITHYRIGADVDGINIRKEFKARHKPLLAVIVIIAALMVFAAEKGPANAAHIAVVEGGVVERYLSFSGLSHWPTISDWALIVKFMDVLLL